MRRCAREDDPAAFEQIVRGHQERLLRYAARMLGGDTDAAADVVQDAFLTLWTGRHGYRPCGRLRAFLLRTVHNRCLDDRRSPRHRRSLPLADCPEPAAPFAPEFAGDVVRDAVMDLSEPLRAVFLLSEYEGLTYAEIAEALDCPMGTVASRKHEAVARLRRVLAPWFPSEKGGTK